MSGSPSKMTTVLVGQNSQAAAIMPCGKVVTNFYEAYETGRKAAIASREPLYHAVNSMMAHLGAHGEIDTRSPLVTAVMDALHDVDDGVYQPAKEIDMEALKRGQENAAKIWTPEVVAEVLGGCKPMTEQQLEDSLPTNDGTSCIIEPNGVAEMIDGADPSEYEITDIMLTPEQVARMPEFQGF